jgi:glycosyltransferase involved in cell wall biosynthesis
MKDVIQKRYNILYTTSFSHMRGGGQWSLYYLIKHLPKDIFHPIVLCPADGELAQRMRGAGAEVIFFDVGRIRYVNPLVIKKFISLIKERHIALIHTDSTTETFYASIAAKMMRIPLIWHIRVSEGEWFFDRILSLLSTRLILVANSISNRFKWLKNNRKTVVVHNGIDLETFDALPAISSIREDFNINRDTVLLGCIGRVEKQKGQEYLISAMKHIEEARLFIVGNVEERYLHRIKALSKELKVSNRIAFIPYRDDIPSLLKTIDILVLPTLTEGFSRIILEAMAAQKPVVATNVGGNTEAVVDGETGYIVPSGDSFALAGRINELIADKKKRKKMGQAGRKRVESKFTIQVNVERIQKVYEELLQRGLYGCNY